jgi:hypothetical protein
MNDNTNLKVGDLVVGNSDPSKSVYTSTGAKITDGVRLAGDHEAVSAMRDRIIKEATAMGGQVTKPHQETGGRSKKQKVKKNEYSNATEIPLWPITEEVNAIFDEESTAIAPTALETVIFENDFGKIRTKVETILDHEQAMLLIFSSDDEVVFEPKVGETLKFYRNKIPQLVYYPGVIFEWTDGVKRAMILFKKEEENE